MPNFLGEDPAFVMIFVVFSNFILLFYESLASLKTHFNIALIKTLTHNFKKGFLIF